LNYKTLDNYKNKLKIKTIKIDNCTLLACDWIEFDLTIYNLKN